MILDMARLQFIGASDLVSRVTDNYDQFSYGN